MRGFDIMTARVSDRQITTPCVVTGAGTCITSEVRVTTNPQAWTDRPVNISGVIKSNPCVTAKPGIFISPDNVLILGKLALTDQLFGRASRFA